MRLNCMDCGKVLGPYAEKRGNKRCRPCSAGARRKPDAEKRLRQRIYDRAWRETHRDQKRAYDLTQTRREKRKIYARTHREKHKARRWARTHGLTLEGFNSMLAGQGGVCAVCHGKEWGKKGPCVDHDHVNGFIRGILCLQCNTAAGSLRDDPKIARKLADYLEKNMEEK